MHFSTTCLALVSAAAVFVAGSPVEVSSFPICKSTSERTNTPISQLTKRETSFGNPDLVTDQGNQYKLNFGSTDGHPNACPGHFICCE
jgi:hypothetical protein